VKPAPFAYIRSADLATVDDAMRPGETLTKIIAGGQSLVPMLNLRLAPADRLVDIRGLAALRQVEERPNAIIYGALLTHATFEDRLVPDGSNGLMPHIAARIAFRSVRNRGTIGGALALADPAADWLTAIIALEALIHVHGPDGDRVVPAENFVLGPYFTDLGEADVLTAIEVPRRKATERWGTCKVAIKAGEYAESLAIALLDREGGTARVVVGATDGAPLVLAGAAQALLDGAAEADLRRIAGAELEAADRAFSPAKLTMHTTTALRAARDAAVS
jgi:aerobic carbon-monoxide dehydrogenase medium subunit